jgi:hypothetical protein
MRMRARAVQVAAGITLMLVLGANAELATAAPHQTTTLRVRPSSGPVGTTVHVRGSDFSGTGPCPYVSLSFTDARTTTSWGIASITPDGTFKVRRVITQGAATGVANIRAMLFSVLAGRCSLIPAGG